MLIQLLCLLFNIIFLFNTYSYELTLIGDFQYSGSISRLGFTIAQMCKDDFDINYINCKKPINYKDISEELIKLIKNNRNSRPGKVAFLYSPLWHIKFDYTSKIPKNSNIKIAYSMLESDRIPSELVRLLNSKLDAVAVPDAYWKEVYRQCGVNIPIFILPCPLDLKEYLEKSIKSKPGNPFVFGCSATFIPRKNLDTLVKAFALEFGNDKNVMLRLQGRYGSATKIKSLIDKFKLKNIELITRPLKGKDYINLMESIDCYVYISKGEGFSISPREAMALGTPCILSDNTAHTTVCKTGLVYPVQCNKREPAYHASLKGQCGDFFNCDIVEVRKALRSLYNNYHDYLSKGALAREWAKQYHYEFLKPFYCNLIKPKKVIFGKKNEVTKNYLMTNSKSLYKKYQEI